MPEPIFSIKSISLNTLINSLFLGAVTPLKKSFFDNSCGKPPADVISILSEYNSIIGEFP